MVQQKQSACGKDFSTTDLTDGSGNSVDGYTYDVFGAIRSQSGSSDNPWLFTGEQMDSTGLQYLRARYYDPAIGRFLTEDPLLGSSRIPQSLNRYAYALNNCTNLVDPWGLVAEGTGWEDRLIEELLMQDCLKLASGTVLLGLTAAMFATLPFFVASMTGVPAALVAVIAVESGVMFLASDVAAISVGAAAYEVCTDRN